MLFWLILWQIRMAKYIDVAFLIPPLNQLRMNDGKKTWNLCDFYFVFIRKLTLLDAFVILVFVDFSAI